jgi:hypothetical protein
VFFAGRSTHAEQAKDMVWTEGLSIQSSVSIMIMTRSLIASKSRPAAPHRKSTSLTFDQRHENETMPKLPILRVFGNNKCDTLDHPSTFTLKNVKKHTFSLSELPLLTWPRQS